jgi:hypothetical protein
MPEKAIDFYTNICYIIPINNSAGGIEMFFKRIGNWYERELYASLPPQSTIKASADEMACVSGPFVRRPRNPFRLPTLSNLMLVVAIVGVLTLFVFTIDWDKAIDVEPGQQLITGR